MSNQAITDFFSGTGGRVEANQQMTPAETILKLFAENPEEAAAILLNRLTDVVGKEKEARAILADIPEAAYIVKLLPKRKQGRRAEPVQQRIDAAWLEIHDWRVAEGKKGGILGTARYIHEDLGIGTSIENVRRKLHALLAKR